MRLKINFILVALTMLSLITLEAKKLDILTTTGMIEDVVKNIGKDKVKVKSLMSSGIDPHLYKATYEDLKDLQNADIIFYNGLHLEGKMDDILKKLSKKKPVFAISEKLKKNKIIYEDGAKDPHIWFDVSIWIEATKQIASKLNEHDSKNKHFYEKNAQEYINKLTKLHKWVKKEISSIPKQSRILITAHDAFSYFGKAYGIEVRGLQGMSTATEFGLNDIKELKELILIRKIKAVFVESSVPKKFLESLVQGVKAQSGDLIIAGELYSDAMGLKGTKEGTYIGMVEHNVKTITKALK